VKVLGLSRARSNLSRALRRRRERDKRVRDRETEIESILSVEGVVVEVRDVREIDDFDSGIDSFLRASERW
jgi:hypothetical protein